MTFFISLGRTKCESLLNEALDSVSFLESEPTTTQDYVNYITFVDRATQKLDIMESSLDYVKELYDIMEEFGIRVPVEDTAIYLVYLYLNIL